MYYYVKYKALFVKDDNRFNYSIYDDYDLAYWSYTHSSSSVAFGKVDDSVFLDLLFWRRKIMLSRKKMSNKKLDKKFLEIRQLKRVTLTLRL